MSLSPEQIVAEEFRLRARGYDRDEVDAFLDRLADQVEADAAQRHGLEQRLAALAGELTAAREREATLTRTLDTVQDAADRVRADAEVEVATLRTATERELVAIREQANREADQLRAAAQDEADHLRAAAQDEATQLRASASSEAAELGARLREAQHLDAAHREQLRAHLETQLQALEALPDPYTELVGRAELGAVAVRGEVRESDTSMPVPPEPSPEAAPVGPSAGDAAGGSAAGIVPPAPPLDDDADPWRRYDDDDGADDATPSDEAATGAPEEDGEGHDGHEERPVEPDPPIWS